jgi:preprotein translocase subunit SecF
MAKIIKKYRIPIVIFIVLIIIVCTILAFKSFLYPSDTKSVYGGRLDGIEEVKIDSNKKMSVVNEIKTNDEVETSSINVQGKIINIVIRGKDELTIEKAKEIVSNSMKKFSDEQKAFYDIQLFITGKDYVLMGYKNKMTADIVWTETKEVEEDEEQAE